MKFKRSTSGGGGGLSSTPKKNMSQFMQQQQSPPSPIQGKNVGFVKPESKKQPMN